MTKISCTTSIKSQKFTIWRTLPIPETSLAEDCSLWSGDVTALLRLCLHLPHLILLSLSHISFTLALLIPQGRKSIGLGAPQTAPPPLAPHSKEGGRSRCGHENWQGPLDHSGRQRRIAIGEGPRVARFLGETRFLYFVPPRGAVLTLPSHYFIHDAV